MWSSVLVHMAVIPVGLAILLIPDRPYRGIEGQVFAHRIYWLRPYVKLALNDYLSRHGSLPPGHTYGEVLAAVKDKMGAYADDPGLWAAEYLPDYSRFDTSEARRGERMEWNQNARAIQDVIRERLTDRNGWRGFDTETSSVIGSKVT